MGKNSASSSSSSSAEGGGGAVLAAPEKMLSSPEYQMDADGLYVSKSISKKEQECNESFRSSLAYIALLVFAFSFIGYVVLPIVKAHHSGDDAKTPEDDLGRAFLIQVTILPLYLPSLFLLYFIFFSNSYANKKSKQEVRELERIRLSLAITKGDQSFEPTKGPKQLTNPQQSVWDPASSPARIIRFVSAIAMTWAVVVFTFAISHPYVITKLHLHQGILEDRIDIFNITSDENGITVSILRALMGGRIFFWGWVGAYAYSFSLLTRRLLSSDLSPAVYIFAAQRFLYAWVLAGVVAISVNSFTVGDHSSSRVAAAFLSFSVGFFPDSGLSWIRKTAYEKLNLGLGNSKSPTFDELSVALVEGVDLWQQERLEQEGVNNLQNLAEADVSAIVAYTNFNAYQVVDWVDQAILCYSAYKSNESLLDTRKTLMETFGLRKATDIVNLCETKTGRELVEGRAKEDDSLKTATYDLKIWNQLLKGCPNLRVLCIYRWERSSDPELYQLAQRMLGRSDDSIPQTVAQKIES